MSNGQLRRCALPSTTSHTGPSRDPIIASSPATALPACTWCRPLHMDGARFANALEGIGQAPHRCRPAPPRSVVHRAWLLRCCHARPLLLCIHSSATAGASLPTRRLHTGRDDVEARGRCPLVRRHKGAWPCPLALPLCVHFPPAWWCSAFLADINCACEFIFLFCVCVWVRLVGYAVFPGFFLLASLAPFHLGPARCGPPRPPASKRFLMKPVPSFFLQNGCMACEAVVFFNRALVDTTDFRLRWKRSVSYLVVGGGVVCGCAVEVARGCVLIGTHAAACTASFGRTAASV